MFTINVTNFCTSKSFSEALILASTNPQKIVYGITMKNTEHGQPMFCTCSFHGYSMNNLLSYCGLIDTKIRVSDKELPVPMLDIRYCSVAMKYYIS